jgi:NAD(P)-dependent dehydrogenase (short-subunit alcohol dehydrogenase family)
VINTRDMGKSQVAVVTGGADGIGLGIAECLAEAAYDIAVWDIRGDLAEEAAVGIAARGVRAVGLQCDVSQESSVREALVNTRAKLGSPAVLVNNAGSSRRGRLEDVSLEDWQFTIGVNLTGPFLCTREVGRDMLEAGSGAIVNVASISSRIPTVFRGAYSPSKAGLVALTQVTALEWGPRGIRCNAVSPAQVRTRGAEPVYAIPELLEERRRMVPLHRISTPKDIGRAVAFLASDAASYITGTVLEVDGGFTLTTMWNWPSLGADGEIVRPAALYD